MNCARKGGCTSTTAWYIIVQLLKPQRSRDPLCNCLNPVSNRTETAVWFRNQIAIMSTMSKKLRNACRNCSLNHESAFKPKSYQLPTTAMSYNQSLSSLPPSASLADLNLFGALVSHHTSFMVPCSLNDPSRLTLLPCTEEVSRDGKKCCPKSELHNYDQCLNLPGGYESGDQTRFHSIFFCHKQHLSFLVRGRRGSWLGKDVEGTKRDAEIDSAQIMTDQKGSLNRLRICFPTISQPFPNHFPTISQSIPKRRELSVLLWSLH